MPTAPAPTPVLDALRARRDALLEEHRTITTRAAEIVAAAESGAEVRDLTADEATELRDLTARREVLERGTATEAGLEALDQRIADIEANSDAERRAGEIAARLGVRVTRNEDLYRRGGEHSFFADLYARDIRRESRAAERLDQHMRQVLQHRDITVSSVAGMVPPVYLVDEYAALARAGRPFLNSLNARPLPPEGVSFTIPRVTTGSAGAQTSEGAGWNEQDIAVTNLTRTVELTTAQQDMSRTLFERGGAIVDDAVMGDLMAAAELALNVSALNGSGTTPQHLGIMQVSGINAVTYTDASPTVGELWPKLADAIQRINAGRYMPATAIYMHPRRWGWITAAVDTTGRPLFDFSTTPPNVVVGLGVAAEYGQVVGKLQGLPVITDASIPTNLGAGTNEDMIVVARTPDILYWEDAMLQFTMEQALTTAPGQVRVAVGRFALFMAGRYPVGISTIGGTGLVTPTF